MGYAGGNGSLCKRIWCSDLLPPSCPPVELEKKKQAEIDEYNRNQRAEYDEGRRQAKLERERLESMKMAVEGPEKTIKKKRKLKGGRSKSDSSYKRSN